MASLTRVIIAVLVGFSLMTGALAAAQSSQASSSVVNLATLTDAAEAQLQQQLVAQPDTWVSSWLAAAPVLSAAALASETTGGSDELEIALTLPLISPSLNSINADWQNTEQQLQQLLLNYRRWYASGQIRDLVWRIAIHQQQQSLLDEQLATYQQLIERLQQQSSLNETDSYYHYLYQQAQTELAVTELEQKRQITLAKQQLQQLTGLAELPSELLETSSAMHRKNLDLNQHPELALMQAQEQLLNLQYEQALSRHAPWQLTTRVKRVSSPGFDDNQIGVQLDIPLGLGRNQMSQADQSDYKLNQQQWLNDYQQLRIALQQQYQQALSELEGLEQKYQLLRQGQAVRKQAKTALMSLLERQEINLDIAQQRLAQIFAEERQLRLLETQIHQATANLNQSAGVSL